MTKTLLITSSASIVFSAFYAAGLINIAVAIIGIAFLGVIAIRKALQI